MKVLLSIKPEFAEKILSGEKQFEFRKKIFKNKSVKTVVIYATMPIGKVIGEFEIDEIIENEPKLLWVQTKKNSGITKSFFDDYFKEKKTAFAICVGRITRYEKALSLSCLGDGIVAPQSYRYL